MKKSNFLKALGPGLIFAGTCIGVSHLVQSTRAGALYGFGLLWVVALANIIKFPFFEFSHRYVTATGEHLLKGYDRVGRWAFVLFLLISLCTMFPIQAGVTILTTGLFVNLIGFQGPIYVISIIIFAVCCSILLMGKYPLLDKLMKVMILLLGISTLIAFSSAFIGGSQARPEFMQNFEWNVAGISFVVVLVGWMPTTLEIGVWQSFWCTERRKQTGYHPSMDEALCDFHIGFWGTMLMAFLFLGLGALVMYGTGEALAETAVGFSGQIISLYTKALGGWASWLIAIAAATTMFSTTIACLDAFPRVIREAMIMVRPELEVHKHKVYGVAILIISAGSTIIIAKFAKSMTTLIDFATTIAFVATPVLAYLNYKVVTCDHMPIEHRPGRMLRGYSRCSLVILAIFSLGFLYWRFLMPR